MLRGGLLELAAMPDIGEQLAAKAEPRRAADEAVKPLAVYRAAELAEMRRNFYGFDPFLPCFAL